MSESPPPAREPSAQQGDGSGAAPAGRAGSSPQRLSTWQSLVAAATSWRTLSVVLLSFSSGLPLAMVWIAIPDWLRSSGVDIRIVGWVTLAQAPWTFKFLWSPLMDRYSLPFLGRRRGWALVAQIALFAATLGLAGVGHNPETPWVVAALALAIAFASATQDIAVDAYTVDVLRPEEQGVAVGARIALYRAAMFLAGGIAISAAARVGWPVVCIALACLYLPMMVITVFAPDPEVAPVPPKTFKEAVWYPFLGFLSRHRALEILAFVLCYKLADNLGQALLRPFLVDMGYSADDRGVALTTIATVTTLLGAFLGGALTPVLGLGRSLWIFGFLQIFSNIGYVLVANSGIDRPLMFSAMGFESLTQGLGTGAFSVLLLRLTQKRFSATQYALFSSMFGIPRVVTGLLSGYLSDSLGWTNFFWLTMVVGIPGLVLLARFVPFTAREPVFEVQLPSDRPPLTGSQLTSRGLIAGALSALFAVLLVATMSALRAMRVDQVPFDLIPPLTDLMTLDGLGGVLRWLGILAFAAICGLLTAAIGAARHGAGRELAPE
jgi:PAT family beta-lactamase induction signal transducer AmpG